MKHVADRPQALSPAQHHPHSEHLLEVAAGVATPACATLVAAHMVMCPTCRTEVARLEENLAALVFGDPAALDDFTARATQDRHPEPNAEAAQQARADGGNPQRRRAAFLRRYFPKRVLSEGERRRLPGPLLEAIEAHSDQAWRPFLPGVERIALDGLSGWTAAGSNTSDDAGRVALLNLAPGLRLFEHSHQGSELTLVLSGAYRDQTGRYATGDVATMDEGSAHAIEIEAGEPCIALVVQDALLQPSDRRGRMARRVTRLIQGLTGDLSLF